MASETGTLENLVSALAGVFMPLRDAIDGDTVLDLLTEFGLQFPDSLAADPGFSAALTSIGTALTTLPDLITSLISAVEGDDAAGTVQLDFQVIQRIAELIKGLTTVANTIAAQKATFPGLTPAEVQTFCDALPKRLFDYLVIRQVEGALPLAAASFDFIGVFIRTDQNVGSTDPLRPPFTSRELHLGGLSSFLKSPGDVLLANYGWGSPAFDGRALLQKLAKLAPEVGLPAAYTDTGTPTLDVVFLEVQPKTDTTPPGLQLQLDTPLKASKTFTTQGANWSLEFDTDIDTPVQTTLELQPDGSFAITTPAPTLQGQVNATFLVKPDAGAQAYTLIGDPNKSRLEFQQFSIALKSTVVWNTATSKASGDFSVDAHVKAGQLVIDLSEADGFISTLLSGGKVTSQFDIDLGVAHDAFYFNGTGGLSIQLPLHLSLGPVEIQSLTIGIGLNPDGIPVSLGVDAQGDLGPLVVVVQNIGMTATFAFKDQHDGNLGPLDVGFAFKPPTGAGLSVDAGVIEGGGFLYIDTQRGEYAGALQLMFADFLSLAAIGLITTKMPDGSSGFSLLVIITADFGSGIQLGFGFTLLAVGGLIGLNRMMLFQPLMDGIRTGAVDAIMFPQDVVKNAMKIISDLRAIFPPQDGTFLIGPMAKLGWGEPTLISLSLGVIIEIPPGDIAILGVLKLSLPADDIAVVLIQVNFAGALEFDKSRVYFFASLYDSRVLFITIEGEMGLLMAWGDDANFVVSVGGFHPQFTPPPLPFPSPQRIEVDILNESFARIRCEGYFAVTSNTAQFGSQSDFFFGFSACSVEGHSGFDALLQFSPFHFTVDVSTSFSVKVFGVGVYGIGIDLTVEGPTPWHVHGTASLSFFFFSIDIGIDVTWGDSRDTMLPPVQLMPLLSSEFSKQSNWQAVLPPAGHLLVVLRTLDPSETAMVLHPVGTLQVSQRLLPLDLTLDKAGNQAPSDANRFSLSVSSPSLVATRTLQEQFAVAQFENLSDAQKLSQAAFSPLDSGVELAAKGLYASGTAISNNVRYDLTIIDTSFRSLSKRFFVLVGSLFTHFLNGSSVARSQLSAYRQAQTQPWTGKVTVSPESFAVALVADNTVYHPEAAAFTSQAAANDYLARAVANDPNLADTIHAIPHFEVAA